MKKHTRCKHSKIKFTCRKCSPGSFCIHGKANTRCAECGGGSVCIHKKARQLCRNCSPLGWAKQALLRFKSDAIKKKIKPPDITAEQLVKLVNETTQCCGCKQFLIFDGGPRHKWTPCLHHNHVTGEVLGFAHGICNFIEGQLGKLTSQQRVCLLNTFFPETVSQIKDSL